MRFIRYITLQTALWRDFYEIDVGQEGIEYCQALIGECVGHHARQVPIALVENYLLMAMKVGTSLYGSIWHDEREPVLLANYAISADNDYGLWRVIHERATLPPRTRPTSCPVEPWVALSIEPGLAYHADALEWMEPFERCLAWTWLTGPRTTRGCTRARPRT